MIPSPSKVWSIIEQEDSKGGLIEFRVALFECNRCERKYVKNLGKTKLIVVKREKWDQLNQELDLLRKTVKELEEKLIVSELMYKAEVLSMEVEELKKGKKNLEREIESLSR